MARKVKSPCQTCKKYKTCTQICPKLEKLLPKMTDGYIIPLSEILPSPKEKPIGEIYFIDNLINKNIRTCSDMELEDIEEDDR